MQRFIHFIQPVLTLVFYACSTFASASSNIVVQNSAMGNAFVSGGVSEEEAGLVRRLGSKFSLQLLFSLGEAGAWLTDVRVTILDAHNNKIFSKKSAGPLLYIDLPVGDYQVIAISNESRQSKRFSVPGGKPKRLILNWKDETEDYVFNSKTLEQNDE